MADSNWKSTSIPTPLYDRIQTRHVPSNAASVQAYVAFWTRFGTLVDELIEANGDSPLEWVRLLFDFDVTNEGRKRGGVQRRGNRDS